MNTTETRTRSDLTDSTDDARCAHSGRTGIGSALLARWPTVVGLMVLATNSAGGVDPHIAAMIIILAAMCYLAAAALGSRRSGWFVVIAATIAVSIAMVTAVDAIVMLLLAAAVFTAFGLLRTPGVRREVGIQAAGFVGFAVIALTAMMVGPVLAVHLAAAAAIGHGVWDVIHHHRDKVVTRSLTEFCAVLDFGLGALLLITAWVTML